MKRAWVVAGGMIVVAVSLTPAVSAAARRAPVLSVHPEIVRLGESATVSVSGITSPSLEVRLSGATDTERAPLGWRPLLRLGSTWWGKLPRPAVRGVYRIEIRSGPHSPILRSPHWVLRVLVRGTLQRPSFTTPGAVAVWWVKTVPERPSRLVAIKHWRLPDGDHRDPRLYELFVIAYSPLGDPRRKDRLGIWITAFRESDGGRWRLLEATVAPPA